LDRPRFDFSLGGSLRRLVAGSGRYVKEIDKMSDTEIKGMIGLGHLFPLGQIVTTPAFLSTAEAALGEGGCVTAVRNALRRHVAGDWGDLDEEDTQVNNDALRDGERLLSAYNIETSDLSLKFWIITEWDRSATTILLPSDY
jgi:hypothetical protein